MSSRQRGAATGASAEPAVYLFARQRLPHPGKPLPLGSSCRPAIRETEDVQDGRYEKKREGCAPCALFSFLFFWVLVLETETETKTETGENPLGRCE